MIYVGLLHLNEKSRCEIDENKLVSTLTLYASAPTFLKKQFLTLCYSRRSEQHDKDEVGGNETTLLMGRIFDKASSSVLKLNDFEVLSGRTKEEALEKIWGKYVYIKGNQEGSEFEVVIDSTGQLPFYYYFLPNGDVLFSSDIEILFKVLSQKPVLNWAYLSSFIVYGNSSAIITAFKNVFELPPGCCLKLTKNGHKTELFWNPLSTNKPPLHSSSDSVDVLKATLQPLIEPFKNICVSLSGGLDSSSLVYCLKNIKKEDQTLKAINFFHSAIKSSNESVYARAVCQENGIELIEIDLCDTLPFDSFSKKLSINPNKPTTELISLKGKEKILSHVSSIDSSIYLSGHGSDHIFMHPPAKQALSDYILEKGILGSQHVLKELSHFYRDSAFSLLKENGKSLSSYFFHCRLEKRHPKNTLYKPPAWIKERAFQEKTSDFIHPVYGRLPSQVLPGKYSQIDNLYEGLASIHGEMHQFHSTCYPFFYKPMVEFALSIPTFKLFDKGYDRYPLRQAVSDHFKTETVWRRSKGHTTGVVQLGIKKNLKEILDLCLEGELVKQGFVDKEGLHQTLLSMASGDYENLWPVMSIASTELFLRYWGCH